MGGRRSISRKHRKTLIAGLKHAFTGRGGDLLIIFQNTGMGEGTPLGDGPDAERALNCVTMLLDAINTYAPCRPDRRALLGGVEVVEVVTDGSGCVGGVG